jgi:hypothetical protein
MRITLSATDSQRWASSPEGADAVEELILEWATGHHITEPVVVVTSDHRTAFAFYLGGDADAR